MVAAQSTTWADTGPVSAAIGSVLALRQDAADDRDMTEQITNEKTIALVTGANKGIGYQIAAGLGALGCSVGVGARDDGRREAAVGKLRMAGIDAFGVPLDVTDDVSAVAAARLIEERTGRLDVLVNNAGVTGGMPQEPTHVSSEQVRRVVETNVIGVMRVTNAMLPLLRRSDAPRIVNMSSGVGSLSRQSAATDEASTGPISGAYAPSKTFLNAVTVQYARELQDTKILINLACPGFVATDLNGFRGVRSTEQGAAIAIKLATLPDDGPTGGYFEDAGVIPW
jgi:NAD(P)-dependent dehydrogenase (short-subunit alcohol dehydrogenase family)